MLEMKLSVSSGLIHVSVTAMRSTFCSLTNSENAADLFLMDLIFKRQPEIFFEAGPGLRLMSPDSTNSRDDQGLTFLKECVTLR